MDYFLFNFSGVQFHYTMSRYFKNKLTGDGAPRGHAPKAGDVCVYVPWGNISVFYKDFRYTDDLIYLGHVEQGLDILSTQQSDFKVNFSIEH